MKNSIVRIHVESHGVFLAVGEVRPDHIAEILRLHRANTTSGDGILKLNLGTVVTRIRLDAPPLGVAADLVVKETPGKRRGVFACGGIASRSCRDFHVHARLTELGFQAPRPVACTLRSRGTPEIAVSELVREALPLRDLLWLGARVIRDDDERAALYQRLGTWLREVHARGVWQRDLKPSNVLVQADHFVLVDITDVRIRKGALDPFRCQRNLAQLLDLTPDLDGEKRRPLLRAYLGDVALQTLVDWESRVDKLIEERRDYRQSRSGFRHVDEEHFRRARAQE